MPFLDEPSVRSLLFQAREFRANPCPWCISYGAVDYCRSCDEFYPIHEPKCRWHETKHHGHRLTIVPYVEER